MPPEEVARLDPEVILASRCGKPVRSEAIVGRPGWGATSAVRAGRIHELSPTNLLQPGPAALTDGLDALHLHVLAAVLPMGK